MFEHEVRIHGERLLHQHERAVIADAQCGHVNRSLFALQRHMDTRVHPQEHALAAAPLFSHNLVLHRWGNSLGRNGRRFYGRRNCLRLGQS